MHRDTALACLGECRIVSTRSSLQRPGNKILGQANLVRARLATPVTPPFAGMVADAVPFTFTPHTTAVLGSCGKKDVEGAERIRPDELVVAIMAYADLLSSGMPFLFCDRNPIRRGAVMTETVALANLPWDRFREHRFAGGQADPEGLARYAAEVMVWGSVPLGLVLEFAVIDHSVADALNPEAIGLGWPGIFVARSDWFFD
jgi:hypothetical protein